MVVEFTDKKLTDELNGSHFVEAIQEFAIT